MGDVEGVPLHVDRRWELRDSKIVFRFSEIDGAETIDVLEVRLIWSLVQSYALVI